MEDGLVLDDPVLLPVTRGLTDPSPEALPVTDAVPVPVLPADPVGPSLVEEAVKLPTPLPVPEALRVGAPEEDSEGTEDLVGGPGDPEEVGDPVCVPLPPAKLPEAVSVGALPLPLPLAVSVAKGVAQEEGVAEDVPVATKPLTVMVGVLLPEDKP